MNYYAFIGFFNGLVTLSVGVYVLLRNKRSSLYRSFAIFALSGGFWSIFYGIWQFQVNKEAALFFIRLAMLPCYFICFSFLGFSLYVTRKTLKKWQLFLIYGTPFFFTLFSFTKLMIKNVEQRLPFPFWPVPGFLSHFYVISFFAILGIAFWILISNFLKAQGSYRWQLKWVIITTIPIWVGGSTNWFLWYNIPIPPAPNFFVGIGFLVLFYVIIRNRLLDVDVLADFVHEAKLSAIGILAASINHEIKNPLYVIKGLAELHLEKDSLTDKSKEIMKKTICQTNRALEIMKNFNVFIKRQTAKNPEKEMINLKQLLENIQPLVKSEFDIKKIKFILDVPEHVRIYFDKCSLEEIFFNLIVNACHAMANGGELRIKAKDNKEELEISVKDTGLGMAPDQTRQVFEPFYSTRGTAGTGLGLYVVKQLIERNNGKITVKSVLNEGTVFTLKFRQLKNSYIEAV